MKTWRIADHADLAWRLWGDEYVFHHALSNDTHRLSLAAGRVLIRLSLGGEMEEAALASACGLDAKELDGMLLALEKIDCLAWR